MVFISVLPMLKTQKKIIKNIAKPGNVSLKNLNFVKDCPFLIKPIKKCQCCPHIETNQLICCPSQLTGFYIRETLALNGLKKMNKKINQK